MRDTRLTNLREYLTEALEVNDKKVRGLMRGGLGKAHELLDENIHNHQDYLDVLRAEKFILAAIRFNMQSSRLMHDAFLAAWEAEARGVTR